MNELLHKFKLGNDAELLLEKRGGGYEKVATVPQGSTVLTVRNSAQGVVFDEPTAAGIRALGSTGIASRRSNTGTRLFGGRLEYDFDNTVPNSWEDVIAVPAEYDAVRIIYAQGRNAGDTTATPNLVSRVSSLANADNATADAADWTTSVTKNGSASIALAKGAASQRRGYTVSDLIRISALPKNADGMCLLGVRTWVNGGNPLTLAGNTLGTEDYQPWVTHEKGRIWKRRRRAGDFVSANQANFSASAVLVNDSPVIGVQYITREKVLTVGVVGDSIATGVAGARYRCEGFVGRAAFDLSTPSAPVDFVNLAWPAHAAVTYANHIEDAIAAGIIPSVLVLPAATPNEISTTISDADIKKSRGLMARIIAACGNSCTPVVYSWMPSNNSVKAYGATDALRVAYAALIESSTATPVIHASTIVSGAAHASGQIELAAGMSLDGIHLSAAAEVSLLEPTKTAIVRAAGVPVELSDPDITATGRHRVSSKISAVSGTPSNAILNGVEKLLQKNGVVGSLTTDDSSNFQEFIEEARVVLNGALTLPSDFNVLRLDNGITLDVTKDVLSSMAPVVIDASHMVSDGINWKYVINIDNVSMPDGNAVPLKSMLCGARPRFAMIGAGDPYTPGADKVGGIRVRGTAGRKAYLYKVEHLTLDGFAVGVELAGAEFGTKFQHGAIRPAKGAYGFRALNGDGTDLGEGWTLRDFDIYNGVDATGIFSEVGGADWWLSECHLDYNRCMVELHDGRMFLNKCHVETNLDNDYLFKILDGSVSQNGVTTLSAKQTVFVFNNINRQAYHLGKIADNIELGGVFFDDCPIYHASGYALETYWDGTGRAIQNNTFGFAAQSKAPFSRRDSIIEYGFETANAMAVWATSGSNPPVRSNSDSASGAYCMAFPAAADATQAELTRTCRPGQQVRMSYKYKKLNSATGQAKLQIVVIFQSKTTAGAAQTLASYTVRDQDGNTADWTAQISGTSVSAPAGTEQVTIRIIKSADTGAVGLLRIDNLIPQVK